MAQETDATYARALALCKEWDSNGDGHISRDELRQVLQATFPESTEADVDSVLQAMDKNNDGKVQYGEFLEWVQKESKGGTSIGDSLLSFVKDATYERALALCKEWDSNGDGHISRDELQKVLKAIFPGSTEADVDSVLQAMDKNSDGKVQYGEFLQWVQKESKGGSSIADSLHLYVKDATYARALALCKQWDSNGDGHISRDELKQVLQATFPGSTEADVDSVLQAIDTNKDGKVQYGEFLHWVQDKSKGGTSIAESLRSYVQDATYARALALCKEWDSNGDGHISRDELRQVLQATFPGSTEADVDSVLQAIDTNKDGKVQYGEFLQWIQTESKGGMSVANSLRSYVKDATCARALALCKKWDLNGDGHISRDELRQLLQATFPGSTEADVDSVLQAMDKNKDGKVQYGEFLEWVQTKSEGGTSIADSLRSFVKDATYERAMALCKQWDTNGDGHISRDELREVLQATFPGSTEADVDSVLQAIDKNKDGKVQYGEFLEWVQTKSEGGTSVADSLRYYVKDATYGRAMALCKQWDLNGDGHISHEELRQVLQATFPGSTEADVDSVLQAIDTNKDGKVQYGEFLNWVQSESKGGTAIADSLRSYVKDATYARALALCKQWDTNGDGHISRDELRQVLQATFPASTEADVDSVLQAIDKNKDGKVQYGEFLEWVQTKSEGGTSIADSLRSYVQDATYAGALALCKKWDANGDGHISRDELRQVLQATFPGSTEADVDSVLQAMDKNHDGKVQYGEFLQWVQKESKGGASIADRLHSYVQAVSDPSSKEVDSKLQSAIRAAVQEETRSLSAKMDSVLASLETVLKAQRETQAKLEASEEARKKMQSQLEALKAQLREGKQLPASRPTSGKSLSGAQPGSRPASGKSLSGARSSSVTALPPI